MKILVVCSLFVAGSYSMPQGYPLGNDLGAGISCGEGEVLNVDGSCSRPVVTRNIFVYAAPEQPRPIPGPVDVPPPKVDYNIVFVRAPENNGAQDPIIVPPPQQRTLVYVLSKKPEDGGQRVIEVPAGPASNPEVYFVNYGPGENPQLPGGVNLQTALGAAAAPGGAAGGQGDFDFRDATILGGADAGLGGAQPALGGPQPAFGGPQPSLGGAAPAFGGAQQGFGGPQQAFVGPQGGFGGGNPGFNLDAFNQGALGRSGNLGGASGLGGAGDFGGAADLNAAGAGGVPLPGGQQFNQGQFQA